MSPDCTSLAIEGADEGVLPTTRVGVLKRSKSLARNVDRPIGAYGDCMGFVVRLGAELASPNLCAIRRVERCDESVPESAGANLTR